MEEEEKIPKKNSTVSFKRRLSVDEKIKVIPYTKEWSIHSVFNYYRVSRPTIRCWIKGKDELMNFTNKMRTVTLYKVISKKIYLK